LRHWPALQMVFATHWVAAEQLVLQLVVPLQV
jgi:hypothetical protein